MHRSFLLAALMAAAGLTAARPAMTAEDPPPVYPARSQAAALLTALFYHDLENASASAAPGGTAYPAAGAVFSSSSPGDTGRDRERRRVMEFSRSLIYEGGYYPKEIYQLLGYENPSTARIARITRQLDQAAGTSRPAPWEAAGRVGRSGMSGVSDHWAMAAGEAGGEMSTPGTLAYLPSLAVVYAAYPEDGCEAAAQLAILKDDDMRAAPAARSAFSLLARALVERNHDRDGWLREAARDSLDPDTEHDIRAVRVKDWKYLRGEECAMGRLERAVWIWYKGRTYQEIMQQGRELLRSRESLAYLSSLAAVTYGTEGLPGKVISAGAADRQLLELVNDLHDLAVSEAVLRVAPEGE